MLWQNATLKIRTETNKEQWHRLEVLRPIDFVWGNERWKEIHDHQHICSTQWLNMRMCQCQWSWFLFVARQLETPSKYIEATRDLTPLSMWQICNPVAINSDNFINLISWGKINFKNNYLCIQLGSSLIKIFSSLIFTNFPTKKTN